MGAYSMKNVAVTIDGQRVLGLWDGDDAVQIAPVEDVGSLMVGADGSSLFSQFTNDAAVITLRLQHTSPTHRLLHQKLARQKARGVKVQGFPFTAVDVDSGEGGAADLCYIQGMPTDAKGKAAGAREWTLVTGNWAPTIPNVS